MAARLSMLLLFVFVASSAAANVDFNTGVQVPWGAGHARVLEDGRAMTLWMDQSSGARFESKNEYLFGRFDMQVKVVPGHSAGTVAAFYLSSLGPEHDEIDFEFLGNVSGQPYTLHTNVFAKGVGDRDQQFRLWFDPTADFHNYTIIWNPRRIIFLVDNTPIRVHKNHERRGAPYLKSQPMRAIGCLWNGEDWATQQGRVKVDWSKAPFVASFRNLNVNACLPGSPCTSNTKEAWYAMELDAKGRNQVRLAQQKYMIYNYCNDVKRFKIECKLSRF